MKTSSNLSSVSIGTESSNNSSDKYQHTIGGGIFGENCETDMILDALTNENIESAIFIINKAIRENKKINFAAKNKFGIPLLHLLVAYSLYSNEIREIVKQLIPKVKKLINMQDSEGNTIAHYALQLGLISFVQLLHENGADLSIKNSKGFYIVPDNDMLDSKIDETDVYISRKSLADAKDSIFKTVSEKQKKLENLMTSDSELSFDKSKLDSYSSSSASTDKLATSMNSDEFIKKIIDKYHEPAPSTNITNHVDKQALLDKITALKDSDDEKEITSTDYIEQLKKKVSTGTPDKPLMDVLSDTSPVNSEKLDKPLSATSPVNSEKLDKPLSATSPVNSDKSKTLSDVLSATSSAKADDIFMKVSDSKGGRKPKSVDSDIASSFSFDMNVSSSSKKGKKSNSSNSSNSSSVSDDDIKKISRSIINKAGEIHQRVLQKIMELMSVDDFKAKAYKSLIYDKIKKEHPELNNYDRAVEMEKLTTKEFLDTLDVNERVEFLKDLYQKKQPKSPKTTSSSSESPTSTEKPIKKEKKEKKTSTKKTKSKRSSKRSSKLSSSSSDGLIDIHSSDLE
jgi:hypothetical protein